MIGDGLSHVAAEQLKDIILVAGYSAGKCYYQASNDGGQTATELIEVGPSDETQPSVRILTTGEIMVTLTESSSNKVYVSRDWGASFELLEAI